MLVMAVLTGCASVHHVPPKQFQIEANLMQSLHWTEYIGQADGKAYLLRKSAPLVGSKWREDIIFTEVGSLSPEFLRQLQKAKEDRASKHASEDAARKLADPQR